MTPADPATDDHCPKCGGDKLVRITPMTPGPSPSAAHVAAAEEMLSISQTIQRQQNRQMTPYEIALFFARHFPSPPPVQEFAALAARAEDFRGESAGPLYPKQDHEELGDWYFIHLEAMTSEGLHLKSEIAGQLAWRDRERANLIAALGRERARADAAEGGGR